MTRKQSVSDALVDLHISKNRNKTLMIEWILEGQTVNQKLAGGVGKKERLCGTATIGVKTRTRCQSTKLYQ